MTAMNETTILVTDLEEVRQVLAACLMYFTARDLGEAQIAFRQSRPSPLTAEIEVVKKRFDAYFGDFLLAQHEAAQESDDEDEALEVEEDLEEPQEGSMELTEASEDEPLPDTPLGTFEAPHQVGRRLTVDELGGAADE